MPQTWSRYIQIMSKTYPDSRTTGRHLHLPAWKSRHPSQRTRPRLTNDMPIASVFAGKKHHQGGRMKYAKVRNSSLKAGIVMRYNKHQWTLQADQVRLRDKTRSNTSPELLSPLSLKGTEHQSASARATSVRTSKGATLQLKSWNMLKHSYRNLIVTECHRSTSDIYHRLMWHTLSRCLRYSASRSSDDLAMILLKLPRGDALRCANCSRAGCRLASINDPNRGIVSCLRWPPDRVSTGDLRDFLAVEFSWPHLGSCETAGCHFSS